MDQQFEDAPTSEELTDDVGDGDFVVIEDEEEEKAPPPAPEWTAETFDELDLEPNLLEQIKAIGWTKPTPVQGLCLPYTLKGREVAGFAQTGTGKTGVFLITIADHILKRRARAGGKNGKEPSPSAIILAPTRELAIQIAADAEKLLAPIGIEALAIYGGVDYEKQARGIKEGADVLVATPGRIKDYFQKRIFSMEHCSIFVCDEADRMFDMGFIEDVEFFLSKLNESTQKLLFSATTNEQVKELAFEYLENPEYISVNPEVMTPELIEQHAIVCESQHKLKVMLGLWREHQPACAVIFTNTKIVADWLHYKLNGNGIDAAIITGDLPQKKRISLIQQVKEGKIKALIATDVASRGLHISGLTHVYNFDLPDEAANYVHRIGRTARAGEKGSAYSLVCEDYGHNLEPIKELLGESCELNTEWFDESYLAIEDKAGNPFADSSFRSNTMKRDRKDGPAGASRGRGERPRRPRGEDDGRPSRREEGGRPRREESARRGPSPDKRAGAQRGDGQQPTSRHAGPQEPRQAGEGRKRKRRRGGRGRHGEREQHDVAAASTHQASRPTRGGQGKGGQPVEKAAKAPSSPSTVSGMIKKIFSVMFGKRSKKE